MQISAEIRGQYRQFYSSIRKEAPLIVGAMKKCQQEVLYLARRNRLTDGAQQALARHWREIGQEHRLAFAGPVTTPSGETVFVDLRPSPAELVLSRWKSPDWEENVCIMQFALSVMPKQKLIDKKTSISLTSLASASAHAFCRRVQRGGGTMFDATRDLQQVRRWAEVSGSIPILHFVAPTDSGFWLVEILRVNDEGIGPTFDAFARTWISGDDTYDPVIDDWVCRLRTLDPESGEAKDLLCELSETRAQQLLSRIDS